MNKGIITYVLKTMGFSIKENKNKESLIDFFAESNKDNKKYAFIISKNFDLKELDKNEFKPTEIFCKTNDYKLLIVTNLKTQKHDNSRFKVLSFKEFEDFNKNLNKLIIKENVDLKNNSPFK